MKRWKIRRRFAIFSFVMLVLTPVWSVYLHKAGVPAIVTQSLIWAFVAIIGSYIGGVVIDDNWKT